MCLIIVLKNNILFLKNSIFDCFAFIINLIFFSSFFYPFKIQLLLPTTTAAIAATIIYHQLLSPLLVANVITTFPPSQPSSPFPLFSRNLTRLDHYTELKAII
jgi:hypothetical protein